MWVAMRVDDFDFELPEGRIALRPASPRDCARLLVVAPDGSLNDRFVGDLPDLLRTGDALVFNDTKVIPTQLAGVRLRDEGAARISATLIERIDAAGWWAFVKPGRRIAAGDRLRFGTAVDTCLAGTLEATVAEKADDGRVRLDFDLTGAVFDQALAQIGAPPLPPYIASRRAGDARDVADYQTVYAAHDGAVAAPTAGLHFTERLFDALSENGIGSEFVTLHVGAGTFLPVKADDTAGHIMHAESGEISAATADRLNAARRAGGRLVAVGSTSLRLLESAADAEGEIQPFSGATDIFITPGYRFRAIDMLMTNFHLPRSTLFMLVSAISGLATMKRAYAHAIAEKYRFYSYGDACLLYPPGDT
jgi:S-adenosylmethionine:tRNA ribosyltransferase-isomerase